ncbi:MAG: thioredoxin domain-containing protein [Brevibacterium aurantiacum]
MANELASSTSPYLRAHADNPVDWRMWTKDNLAEAARRDVPLLISIGYSTCHWCHVMAHESFEDEAIARIINENFLPIKIDREELPDIDAYYMNALQAMRGQGGWPMTIFATPAGSPFYAGTYFPPAPRGNLPAFTQVLSAVSQSWTDRREEVTEMTQRMDRGLADMASAVSDALPAEAASELLSAEELDSAAESLLDSYDPAWGGFGKAPKFPPLMNLMQLLATFVRLGGTTSAREEALAPGKVDRVGADGHLEGELVLDCLIAVRSTFARIASGGMRDQVRGGIARYSVDRQWFVPHFEKMLYDNGLYLRAAVQWAKVERALNPDSKWLALAEREITDTANFLTTDLSDGDRFIAALDADSLNGDGVLEEGAAYVVTPEEFAEVGEEGLLQLVDSPAAAELSGSVVAAIRIIDWLGMDEVPFDEDHPTPWETSATAAQRDGLRKLLDQRSQPARDEKTITEWNSLAITALAEAALYTDAALSSDAAAGWGSQAGHLWDAMVARFGGPGTAAGSEHGAGTLLDVCRSFTGETPGPGQAGLADWAQFITAGITVRQLPDASVQVNDLKSWGTTMFANFTAEDEVLEVFDSMGDEILDVRASDPVDNTVPSGRSAAAEVALLLAEIGVDGSAGSSVHAGNDVADDLSAGGLLELRDRLLGVYRALAGRAPRGCGHALWQSERALKPVRVATRNATLSDIAAKHPAVTLITGATGVPAEDGSEVEVPEGAAIVCQGTQCSLPVTTAEDLKKLLDA